MLQLALAAALVAAPNKPAELGRIEILYDKAQYDKALRRLGPTCEAYDDESHCEQLRAFILAAIGNTGEARTAFVRMLMVDPEAKLPDDVSPKLANLFDGAKADVKGLERMELEVAEEFEGGKRVTLEVSQRSEVEIEHLNVYLKFPGRETFQRIGLELDGKVWSGSVRLPSSVERGQIPKYYLVADLKVGGRVSIGSQRSPYRLTGGGIAPTQPIDLENELEQNGEEEGLPDWAFWTIIGGGIVVVAVAIGVGVAAASDGDPGTVNIAVQFQD